MSENMTHQILSNKTKKTVKLFTVERKHFNREHRYTEVERIIVLGDEATQVTAEDVEEGLNFDFVPLESLMGDGTTNFSDALRRILRMNFEAALSNLRQYARLERNRQFEVSVNSGIQMNQDVVRMFVPHDLQGPNLVWESVTEPVGQIPMEESSCVVNGARITNPEAQARVRFQDSMSRVGSGKICPNGNTDPFIQRQRIGEIVNYLVARRDFEAHADGEVLGVQSGVPFLNVPFVSGRNPNGEYGLGVRGPPRLPLFSGTPSLISSITGVSATAPSISMRGKGASRRRGRSAARRFFRSWHFNPAAPTLTSQSVSDSYNLLLSMRQRPVEMSTQTERPEPDEVVEVDNSDDEGRLIIQCHEKISPMSSESGAERGVENEQK